MWFLVSTHCSTLNGLALCACNVQLAWRKPFGSNLYYNNLLWSLTRHLKRLPKLLLTTLVWPSVWRVVGTRKLQFSSHHMPKGFSKITYKSNISIWDYGFGKIIQLDNLVKIEFRNFESICGFSTKDKIGHLKEVVDNHKNRIMLLCSMWKPKNKIHTYILPMANGNRQRGAKTSILFFYA
jgi:hypothetical protein